MQPSFFDGLPELTSNAYVVVLNSTGMIVGSASVDGTTQSVAAWGNDSQTTEVDGAIEGEEITLQLVNGNSLYDISTTSLSYITNNFSVLSSSSSNLNCSSGSVDVLGCTDDNAFNYNPQANSDDGSCIPLINGCMDEMALNYNAEANTDDDSCISIVNGCTDGLSLIHISEPTRPY